MTPQEAYIAAEKWHTSVGVVPPELEEVIATSATHSYWYASDILNDRFELGESIIATDASCSYYYAHHILKSRFELGESVISANAHYSSIYSKAYLNLVGPLL